MTTQPARPPMVYVAVLGASLTANVMLMTAVLMPERTPAVAPAETAAVTPEVVAVPTPTDVPSVLALPEPALAAAAPGVVDTADGQTAPVAQAELAVPAQAAPAAANLGLFAEAQVTIARLQTSIPHTLATAAAPYGDNVSATLSRVLVWDLDLRRDLRPGDGIEALWTLGTSDVVVIQAARYESLKFNRTIEAYRFHASGDRYPSYWSADGTEIPHRLVNSPMDDYEQITSLLRDRPTHHGMDFKADVGGTVVSPFDGVVTRVNWNWAANGNCIEIRHNDGVLAKYLHLSENRVTEGQRVGAGDIIALSGNTGRSTGPHLHYQLNRGDAVVDPIEYHGTERRTLPEADRAAFAEVVAAANARFTAARTVASN